MIPRAIVDTGFLVALLRDEDAHRAWAHELVSSLRGPWCTAEACITEAVFLLERVRNARDTVNELLGWIANGLLVSRHLLPEQLEPVRAELFRYHDRWVDFADACIVHLSDLEPKLPVVTVDAKNFAVYFKSRRGRRLLTPDSRRRR